MTQPAPPPLMIVTGMSGAGRQTALNVLEDLGWEAVVNIPLPMVAALVEPAEHRGLPIAIGVESRTRGFSARALTDLLDRLSGPGRLNARLLFLDCATPVLVARYSQSRRRHPLAPAEDPATGIARERTILAEVRARADAVIDTSELTPHQLKAELARRFALPSGDAMSVTIESFSYKRGTPVEADMVLDCRFLANPYWDETLRALDGRDGRIQAFVRADPRFEPFFGKVADLVEFLLPALRDEGKAYFTIALGCTGGRHRSVATTELLAARLAEAGWPARIRHRELEGGTPGGAG